MNGLAVSVPAVRVEGVVKRFGATVALDGAGLEVPGGMVFGLLGPNRPARTYSGGMRRRLDIAPSLLTRPRVLFLDEPTTGLDPRSRNEIWAIVRELRRGGTTLLLTTQYLEEADQLADRIAVIDRGKVIAEGTGTELHAPLGAPILAGDPSSPGHPDRAQAAARGGG